MAIDLRRPAGFLGGGMTSWRQDKLPTEATERLPVDELPGRLDELQVLDVRDPAEWRSGRILGAALTTWHDMDGVPEGLDPERPVAVVCGSGQRAATGASLLRNVGG